MAFGIGKSRLTPIAVDFGADSVKLLQLVDEERPQLVAAACATAPEDARRDLAARFAFLEESVRSLLKAAPFRGRRVVCSIPSFQALVQNLPVADMDEVPLDDRVTSQLRERLLIEPTRMVLRVQDVGQFTRQNRPFREVVCLAAERGLVNRYLQVMQNAKLEVCGMQTEPVALLAAAEHTTGGVAEDQTTLYMDLGAASAKLIVAHGQKMVVVRTASVGGDSLIQELGKSNEMDFTEARAMFLSRAGQRDQSNEDILELFNQGASVATETATATATTGSDTIECLVDEARFSLRYHHSLFPDRNVQKVVFVGGGAAHQWLCTAIAERLGLPAFTMNPTQHLMRLAKNQPFGVSFDEPQPGWAVPMGLCITSDG